jgi:large subunit ribosomal protein L5
MPDSELASESEDQRVEDQPEDVQENPHNEAPESPQAEAGDGNATVEADGAATEEAERPAPRRQRAASGARASRGRRATTASTSNADGVLEGDENVPPPRLREIYRNEIIPSMMQEFGYSNPMEVPRVNKIVLNIGLGEALTNGRAMENATRDLSVIAGQKPVINRARKSIAGFKVREGNPIGTSVTLRGARMFHFLDRFINTSLPRIRDFRGLPRRGFDGRGNFSMGISEQIIFPEIDYNQIDRLRGLQVTITTSAKNDPEAVRLLELYGMPFVRET